MSDIYAARGYGSRPIGFGSKIGFVVVDFQRGFVGTDFPMGGAPMVDDAVRNTVPLILMKSAPSIFFGTSAAAILNKERVDTVIVTGCITSGCVRASVIDAFSLGFRVMVPHDCVGDHDAAAHAQNLKDVERRYADVIDAATAIEAIDQWRRTNDRG